MIPQGLISIDKMPGMNTNLSSGKKIGSGSKDLFSNILSNMLNHSGMDKLSGKGILSSTDVAKGDKAGLLELVKKSALSKWGSLDKLVLPESGLADLEKFLLGAGFDQNSVHSLMEKLKTKMGGRELKLSDLFSALKELENTNEEMSEEGILEISALPYIEVSLKALGMNQSQISTIVNDAKIEGKGINLLSLIENLKTIKSGSLEENSFKLVNSTVVDIPKWSPEKEQNRHVSEMMMRIGMKDVSGKEGTTTLKDFISGLESLLGKKENVSDIASALNTDLKRFFEKVSPKQEPSSQIHAFGLKNKYLSTESRNRSNSRDAFLKEKGQHSVNEEKNLESNLISEKTGKEKVNLEEKFVQKTSASKMDASVPLKFSDKTSEPLPSMTKGENGTSFESVIRDTAHPERFSAVSESRPTPRTLPMYVIDQVGRQIIRSINNGENEIRLQIKPPHLGRLHMTIDNTSDGIRISILAEHRTTRDLILSNTSELKGTILDQGIHINEIDVQVSSDFQQAMQDMRQRESKEKGREQEKPENTQNGNATDMMDGGGLEGVTWFRNGRLDLVA